MPLAAKPGQGHLLGLDGLGSFLGTAAVAGHHVPMPGPPSEDPVTRTNRLHADEVDTDVPLVRRLVAARFPEMGDVMIRPVRSTGTVNAIYRLGDHLYARLPRKAEWESDLDSEWTWLPKLAPHLTLRIPSPVAKGDPAPGYPFSWAVYEWMDGEPYADELIDDEDEAARDLARFVTELRGVEPVQGIPRAAPPTAGRARRSHPRGDRVGTRRDRQPCSHRRLGACARNSAMAGKAGADPFRSVETQYPRRRRPAAGRHRLRRGRDR